MVGGDDEYNFGSVSIIIPNMNQIHHIVWKNELLKCFNKKFLSS